MKKLFKIILILIGIAVFIFCVYVYKLHTLALENNKIFELRCTNVNPPLISYKNSFLKFADFLKTPEKYKEEDPKIFYDDYISGMRKYVVEENKWLELNRRYLNQWDFKLLEPWYMKQAGEYQLKMYEGYRDDAQCMLDIWDNKTSSDELNAKQAEARKRRDEAEQKYFDFFDQASAISDWRKIFGNLPVPKGCNEENMTIPETGGSIDWGGTPTPSPKVIPGLEYLSG